MNDFTVWASEALAADATVSLLGEPELSLTTPAHGRAAQGALLEFGAGRLSWFSREWTLEASGNDLSGHPLLQSGTIRTLEDPGIFPQDGFEGPLLASGWGRIVEENPITGAQSLELSGQEGVTLHLARSGGDTVRFSFREDIAGFVDGLEDPVWLRARALVVGTQDIVTYAGPHSSFEGDATLGSVVEAEIPLETPGDEVIVTFDYDWNAGCTGACGAVGVVIDDLRIE
jgi:hypothetical protein